MHQSAVFKGEPVAESCYKILLLVVGRSGTRAEEIQADERLAFGKISDNKSLRMRRADDEIRQNAFRPRQLHSARR